MSSKFSKTQKGRGKRLFRTSESLRHRIDYAIGRVELQIHRIDNRINRYAERDKNLFEKLVQAYQRHDSLHVNMLANELAEIRGHRNLLMDAKLSLQNVALRLRTLSEFGNLVSYISPVVDTLESVKTRVSGILPEVGIELGYIGTKLNTLSIHMGQGTSATFNFDVSGENTQKIMEEATMIAENQMKRKLPRCPPMKLANELIKPKSSSISKDNL